MKRFRGLLFHLIAVLALAAIGLGAQRTALTSWNAVVNYRSPFAVPLKSGAGGVPLSRRVILIVVDGLRVDAFDRTLVLERLRPRAAQWRAWTEEPSLSLPGWTTIVSGAPPEISGVTTNWYRGVLHVDHVFAAARRSGLRTALVGHPGWLMLLRGSLDDFIPVDNPSYTDLAAIHQTTSTVTRHAEPIIRGGRAHLALIYYPAPDLMGHGYGGASQPYADSVRLLGEELALLLADVDFTTTTVILTADHGHIDTGGHGGGEPVVREVPLLLAGGGIAPGEGIAARQADIAPTIAALLGIPIPSHSVGRPLIESLTSMPPDLHTRWGAQQAAFYDLYSQAVLGRHAMVFTTPLGDRDPGDAVIAAADDLSRQVARWRLEGLMGGRARRLPAALVLAAALAAVFLLQRPRRYVLPATAGAAVVLVVGLGLYFGKGYTLSLSVINREDLLERFFMARTVDAAIAAAAGALLAGWAARRRGIAAGALAGLGAAYLAAFALILVALVFYVRWGIRLPWYLPDMRQGFAFYLILLSLVPIGLLAAPLMLGSLVGYGAGRIGERLFSRGSRWESPSSAAPLDPQR